MSKNTKNKHYKTYLRLVKEEDKLDAIRRNLGYRELEKPVHHGYNAFFVLREDVARRDDAYIYQHLIDTYSIETWSKTTEFYVKKKNIIFDNRPRFKEISEDEYLRLDSRLIKFFYNCRDIKRWDGSVNKLYCCGIPPYYLVMEIKKSYLTHEKIIDSELERQASFISDKLSYIRETCPIYDNNGFAAYRRKWSRKDRQYNKMTLRKNIKMEYAFDDYDYPDYGGSDWTDWCSSSAWSHDPYEFTYQTRSQAKWMWW